MWLLGWTPDPARLRDAACVRVCVHVFYVYARGGGVWQRGVKFGLGSEAGFLPLLVKGLWNESHPLFNV